MWESVCKSYNGLSSTLFLMNYSIFLLPKVTKVLNVTMSHCCTLEQSTCVSMAECSLIMEGDLFSTQRIKKKKNLATPHSIWDYSSLTRAGTHASYIRRQSLNQWTTREDPTAKNFTTLLWASTNMVNCNMLMRLPGHSLLSHFFPIVLDLMLRLFLSCCLGGYLSMICTIFSQLI